jgi:hypothetical protein
METWNWHMFNRWIRCKIVKIPLYLITIIFSLRENFFFPMLKLHGEGINITGYTNSIDCWLGLGYCLLFGILNLFKEKKKKQIKIPYLSIFMYSDRQWSHQGIYGNLASDSATPKGSSSPNFVGCCPAGNGTTLIYDQIIYIFFVNRA